ncbi:unnamed protein product [Cylindrotheca closterium]|uniref:Uncharacterized protein n=1 Tax=Cylindrotheca closterium TaxID=2856 RepID=A0AAD2FVT9_9STRA|nr:unnamed protein product [Cylindrotheca closterium]
MAPLADIKSVIDYNDITNNDYSEKQSYALHYERPVRKVSFSKMVTEYDIERASDFSDEERQAIWYSIPQLREIKKQAKHTVQKMERGLLDTSDDNWTFRGLESKTTEGSQQKYEARRSSWGAVFLHQDQQDIQDIPDPEFLAEMYREHTKVSQCLAELQGKQDAEVARE